MKKIFSAALAIIMVFALCLSAAAETPTEVTFGEAIATVSCADNLGTNGVNSRYLIVFNEDVDVGSAYVSVDVDGSTVDASTKAVYFSPPDGATKPYLYIEYRALEDGVTEAANIGRHIVTIKAGTLFQNGTLSLSKDIVLLIKGASVSIYVPKTPLTLTGIEVTAADDDLHRYKVVFSDTLSGAQFGVWSAMTVDGTTQITAADQGISAYNHGDGKLAIYINYSAIQPGAASSSDISAHIITLSKGMVYGDYELAEDVQLKVSGNKVTIYKPATLITLDTIADGAPQNDEQRYLIIFDETTDVGAAWATGYVDGSETGVENAACFMMIGGKVTALLQYRAFGDDITSWEQITEHTITFKAGTELGNNCELADDVNITVKYNEFKLGFPEQEIPLTGDVNGDGAVNNKDVVTLFRAVSGNVPDEFVKEAADVNDDGEINNKDVVQLFRNVSSK